MFVKRVQDKRPVLMERYESFRQMSKPHSVVVQDVSHELIDIHRPGAELSLDGCRELVEEREIFDVIEETLYFSAVVFRWIRQEIEQELKHARTASRGRNKISF